MSAVQSITSFASTPDEITPGRPLMAGGYDFSWAYVIYRERPGFPNYRIGSDGTAWSRLVRGTKTGRTGPWRRLKPRPARGGYLIAAFYGESGRADFSVHRAVLEAFVGPCPDGMEGCHRNHNPADNRLENIFWGTHQENVDASVQAGRFTKWERHSTAKLTRDQVREIRRLAYDGVPHLEIATRFGISRGYVSTLARTRISWIGVPGDAPAPADLKVTLKRHCVNNMKKPHHLASGRMLTEDEVREMRRLKSEGMTQIAIAKQFDISESTLSRIIRGLTWFHIL